MANFADCCLVEDGEGRSCIVAVTSSRMDGMGGCYYTLHTTDGRLVGSGHSKGFDGSGMGSALTAMKNGKASARRYLKSQARRELRALQREQERSSLEAVEHN